MSPLFVLALILWAALTDSSNISLLIAGFVVSLILDRMFCYQPSWKRLFAFLRRLLPALGRSYKEAFEIMLSLRHENFYVTEKIPDLSPWKIFMQVFFVTLTPKTISVSVDDRGEMLVHRFQEQGEEESK